MNRMSSLLDALLSMFSSIAFQSPAESVRDSGKCECCGTTLVVMGGRCSQCS